MSVLYLAPNPTERQERAMQLRGLGWTYGEIAVALNCHRQSAYLLVRRGRQCSREAGTGRWVTRVGGLR